MILSEAQRSAAQFLMVGFDGLVLPSATADLLRRNIFGTILFSRNYASRDQVAALCDSIKSIEERAIAIAVDHEGGRVQRFRGDGFTELRSMRDVGRHLVGSEQRARALGTLIAAELRPLGIDIDFAPVLDVDSNPANPVIGERSFSSDPEVVATLGVELIHGLQDGGVAACGKHFPGHGDTDNDSHFHLPRLSHDLARLRSVELVPFAAASKAHVACMMTSHIIFAQLDAMKPATMSKPVLDLLRDDMKFNGVVISDDLEMKAITDHFPMPEAAIEAVNSGCDLLLVCHKHELAESILEGLTNAIEDGTISEERVLDAELRRATLVRRFVR